MRQEAGRQHPSQLKQPQCVMVSRRFLRLSLLCLLGFMVFGLVVMEVALDGNQWNRLYNQLSGRISGRVFALQNSSSSPSPEVLTMSTPASMEDLTEVTHLRSPAKPIADQGPTKTPITVERTSVDSKLIVHSSLVQRDSRQNGTRFLQSTSTTNTYLLNRTSPSSSVVDHCRKAPPTSGVFSLGAQKLKDGSRPQKCSRCFYSDFPVLLQSCRVCNSGDKGLDMVMMILTTHGAVNKRDAIRRTWASITGNNTAPHVRHVFVLGWSKNAKDMLRVRKEHEIYGDIIMYDFVDTYANLTLKTLTCLHWVLNFCHNARFMLKADDDMWINVPTLLKTVQKENYTLQTTIGGSCRTSAQPIRNRLSKWFASVNDYPQESYPGFCSGTAYVTSLNVVRSILSVSPDVPFFYLEDVYMALCIQRLGPPFRLQGLGGFFHGWASPCELKGPRAISVHEVAPESLIYIWKAQCV